MCPFGAGQAGVEMSHAEAIVGAPAAIRVGPAGLVVVEAAGGAAAPELVGRGGKRVLATVLFTDIVGSTRRAFELGDRRWRDVLQAHEASVRRYVRAHGGCVVKSLGDGHMAAFTGPARAIRCGFGVHEHAESLGLQVKAGVHTGECELIEDDLAGVAVHIGARLVDKARPGEVLATGAVRDLVMGSGLEFEHRGTHELDGVPGLWTLHAATRGGAEEAERHSWSRFVQGASALPGLVRGVVRAGRAVGATRRR